MNGAPGRFLRTGAAAALLLVATASALAHERSVSHARWSVDAEGAAVQLRMAARDLARLPESARPDSGAAVAAAVVGALLTRRGGEPCSPVSPPRVAIAEGGSATLFEWGVRCPASGVFEVESGLPRLLGTPHLCFARIALPGSPDAEVVLHDDERSWTQAGASRDSGKRASGGFFRLGLEHIAGGIDHLLFVLALVQVAATLSEAALVITAFTAAHALTLGAAVLGWLQPAAAPVEALIAVSIAMLAVENLTLRSGLPRTGPAQSVRAAAVVLGPALAAAAAGFGRVPLQPLLGTGLFVFCYFAYAERRPGRRRVRWLVAFVFGLLHGFGFAGALAQAGFSGATVATALLAFHAGVEAGQLMFVAVAWPLLLLLRRLAGRSYARLVLEPTGVVLLAISVGWYGIRAFG